jgi:hypothetical protein
MKKLIIAVFGIFSVAATAQNTNVTDISKTTVTKVKDSDGERAVVKEQNVQTKQAIQFQDAESNKLNKDQIQTPVEVTSTVQITGPDGRTRTVDVDRSAMYTSGKDAYRVVIDNTGYTVLDNRGKKMGLLRQLSTPNQYIYTSGKNTYYGSFDDSGNFVVQRYDEKTDSIITETFTKNP